MRRTIAVMAASDARRAQNAPDQACERLLCMLEKASAVPDAELVVSCDSSDAIAFFREVTCAGTTCLVHEGQNQGDRLRHCFEQLCDPGNGVVAVRSDVPLRPSLCLELAFDALASGDVGIVLGPAPDGFYLVGMRALNPDLLTRIDWDAPDALDEITALAADLGIGWYLLPESAP
jgi:glycosyltransferase A (GT-A) superfamily protein (DUF2064 family)